MEIKVKKKTLFYFPRFKNNTLKIYDSRGNIFYSSEMLKDFKGLFYLPRGIYETDNFITVSRGTLKQPVVKLPPRQRNFGHDFTKFEIEFGNNRHKCSIFHDRKLILFDNSFKKKPYYQLAFIINHEKGHNYYRTEHFADLFAVSEMLKQGFNPSQIIHAIDLTLSDKSEDRKIKIFKAFDNYYKNKKQ